jgi:hypothetical protein
MFTNAKPAISTPQSSPLPFLQRQSISLEKFTLESLSVVKPALDQQKQCKHEALKDWYYIMLDAGSGRRRGTIHQS